MATVEDYKNKVFGQFKILDVIGQGKDADVFSCLHVATGRCYVLRLDSHDNKLWSQGAIIPPYNSKIEIPNIEGTRINAPVQYNYSTSFDNKSGKRKEWTVESPSIYGVKDGRYLIPVASPIRVKSSWDVLQLLNTEIHANIRSYFQLWEDVISILVGEAFMEPNKIRENNDFSEKWKLLTGGDILVKSVVEFISNGSSSVQEREEVVKLVSSSRSSTFLVDNLLFRICACIERGLMTVEQVKATMNCKYFRVNITIEEVEQILQLWNIFSSQKFMPPQKSINILTFVLSLLENQPLDKYNNSEEFEVRTELPAYEPYELFLQEYAGLSQEFISLEANN